MKKKDISKYKKMVLTRFLYAHVIIGITGFIMATGVYGQNTDVKSDSTRIVEGTVFNSVTGLPLMAAQVSAINHEASATTDESGRFKINIQKEGDVLLVKAFDFNEREIIITHEENIEVELYSDVFSPHYIEIQGVTDVIRSSNSINAIKGNSQVSNSFELLTDHVLQSKMGGDVRIIKASESMVSAPAMFIRGLNSVYLNTQPLLVVDGVIWDTYSSINSLHSGFNKNPFSLLDMSDIERISIVKDGTSLYGSKGGNGVVLVNTKRGNDMATKILFNASTGITLAPKTIPVLNSEDYRLYLTDVIGTAGLTENELNSLEYLQDNQTKSSYKKYHNSTDWKDEVYQPGITQNYNIGVNGGDAMALYNLSIGFTGIKGVVKSTGFNRLNTRFNADFFLLKRITMGLNVGFTTIDRSLLDDGANFYTSPTYIALIKSPLLNPYSYTVSGTLTDDVEDSDDFGISNPNAVIEKALNTNKNYRLNLGLNPSFQINPSFSISSLVDFSLDKEKETYYSPIIGVNERYIPGFGYSENVFRSQTMRNITIFDDTRIKYTRQFENLQRLNAILGWRYMTSFYEADFAEGHNSGSDQNRNLLNDEEFKSTKGLNNKIKTLSNYANVEYSIKNKYFLTGVVALDGSSRFGKQTQGGIQLFNQSWGIFPSLNGAWLLSSEQFLQNSEKINSLKLRGGLGLSGNDGFDPYARQTFFVSEPYMNRANGLVLGNIGNNEIQWETTTRINLGGDLIMYTNKVSISLDLYNNYTNNLLFLTFLPETAGEGFYWSNGGKLLNRGLELSTNMIVRNTENVKWEIGASIGHYSNKIVSLPDSSFTTEILGAEILTSVDNPAGLFYGHKTDGIFTTQEAATAANLKWIDGNGSQTYFQAGDVKFLDKDNNGEINENDKEIIGDPNPDVYGSFYNKIVKGRLTVEAVFTFSYGNDIYNYVRADLESGSDFKNQSTALNSRWYYEGQNTSQPKVNYGDPMENNRFSDRWIEDGSYLRVKSITFSYKYPLKTGYIDGMEVWLMLNNLYTLTKYLGGDPEVSANQSVLYQGIDAGLLPSSRSCFVGIRFNL